MAELWLALGFAAVAIGGWASALVWASHKDRWPR